MLGYTDQAGSVNKLGRILDSLKKPFVCLPWSPKTWVGSSQCCRWEVGLLLKKSLRLPKSRVHCRAWDSHSALGPPQGLRGIRTTRESGERDSFPQELVELRGQSFKCFRCRTPGWQLLERPDAWLRLKSCSQGPERDRSSARVCMSLSRWPSPPQIY